MGERLRLVRSATIPPARDLQVARTEDVSWLRADGSPSRVNDTQWRVSRYDLPVTVAGARRACPRLPGSPVAFYDPGSVFRGSNLNKVGFFHPSNSGPALLLG